MIFAEANWMGIVLATLASFVLGFLWYHPGLFGRKWQEETGLSDSDLKETNMALIFGAAFVLTFIVMFVMDSMIIDDLMAMADAVSVGLLIGFGIGAASLGINYAFARKSFVLWLIDAGYIVLMICIGSIILAVI